MPRVRKCCRDRSACCALLGLIPLHSTPRRARARTTHAVLLFLFRQHPRGKWQWVDASNLIPPHPRPERAMHSAFCDRACMHRFITSIG